MESLRARFSTGTCVNHPHFLNLSDIMMTGRFTPVTYEFALIPVAEFILWAGSQANLR